MAMRGVGVTMTRELTMRAEKAPYGRLTQLSETLGSSANLGTTPMRPL